MTGVTSVRSRAHSTRDSIPYVLRRVGFAVFVLWAAYTITFVILYVLPGDPVRLMLDPTGIGQIDDATLAAARERYGFAGTPIEMYVSRLLSVLGGDLGFSLSQRRPVSEVLTAALPPTLALTVAAALLAVVLGVLLAVVATFPRAARLRGLLREVPPTLVSLPTFWVGLVLIQLFAFHLHLLPAIGSEGFASLILPAITLALPAGAVVAQVLIRGIDDVDAADFVDTARMKGLSRSRVYVRHVLRNALVPAVTLFAVVIGGMIAGAVVVETVFGRAGLGRLTVAAVTVHDIALVQGIVLVAAAIYVVLNLAADLIVPFLDPRRTGEDAR